MKPDNLPEYDLWLKDETIERLPSGATHACSYELNLGADRVLELLFLNSPSCAGAHPMTHENDLCLASLRLGVFALGF